MKHRLLHVSVFARKLCAASAVALLEGALERGPFAPVCE